MTSHEVTLLAAILGGLIGGGAAIAAGALAQRGERARERDQWQRDSRAALYTRVMVVHGRLLLARHDMVTTDPGTEHADVVADRLELVTLELMDALMELQVLGSKAVHHLADVVGREISRNKNVDQAELEPKWNALATAMRGELGIDD